MIALAEKLQGPDQNIIFGAGEKQLAFIRSELPGIACLSFPGFQPVYSEYLPQYIVILIQLPVLIYHIIREHFILKKLIALHSIDMVISDNRFGLWNKNIRTVYITHQPGIAFPPFFSILEFIGVYLHRKIIRRYSLCFIPDLPGEPNLTGRLSHGLKLPDNVRFIGILSRFSGGDQSHNFPEHKTGIITVILSGPEPQRGILEKKLTDILKKRGQGAVILGGKPHENIRTEVSGNIIYYSHTSRREMQEIISGSDMIIARAGYTTIMELVSLNCSAVLIPTPGQTEQEYLATRLSHMGWFTHIPQKKLNGTIHFDAVIPDRFENIIEQSRELLDKALKEISEEPQTDK